MQRFFLTLFAELCVIGGTALFSPETLHGYSAYFLAAGVLGLIIAAAWGKVRVSFGEALAQPPAFSDRPRIVASPIPQSRPTKRNGMAIDVEVTADPPLHNAVPYLLEIRRWTGGLWQNSLNNSCPVQLSWLTQENWVPLPFLRAHKLILFVIDSWDRKGLSVWWSKRGFASIQERLDDIEVGKYRLIIRIDAEEGSFMLAFEVDWFGNMSDLMVRSVEP